MYFVMQKSQTFTQKQPPWGDQDIRSIQNRNITSNSDLCLDEKLATQIKALNFFNYISTSWIAWTHTKQFSPKVERYIFEEGKIFNKNWPNHNYFCFQALHKIRENHSYTFYVTYCYSTEPFRCTARSHTHGQTGSHYRVKTMNDAHARRTRSTDIMHEWVSENACDMGKPHDACTERDSVRCKVPWPLRKH